MSPHLVPLMTETQTAPTAKGKSTIDQIRAQRRKNTFDLQTPPQANRANHQGLVPTPPFPLRPSPAKAWRKDCIAACTCVELRGIPPCCTPHFNVMVPRPGTDGQPLVLESGALAPSGHDCRHPSWGAEGGGGVTDGQRLSKGEKRTRVPTLSPGVRQDTQGHPWHSQGPGRIRLRGGRAGLLLGLSRPTRPPDGGSSSCDHRDNCPLIAYESALSHFVATASG